MGSQNDKDEKSFTKNPLLISFYCALLSAIALGVGCSSFMPKESAYEFGLSALFAIMAIVNIIYKTRKN